jgi:hypothetical protein
MAGSNDRIEDLSIFEQGFIPVNARNQALRGRPLAISPAVCGSCPEAAGTVRPPPSRSWRRGQSAGPCDSFITRLKPAASAQTGGARVDVIVLSQSRPGTPRRRNLTRSPMAIPASTSSSGKTAVSPQPDPLSMGVAHTIVAISGRVLLATLFVLAGCCQDRRPATLP